MRLLKNLALSCASELFIINGVQVNYSFLGGSCHRNDIGLGMGGSGDCIGYAISYANFNVGSQVNYGFCSGHANIELKVGCFLYNLGAAYNTTSWNGSDNTSDPSYHVVLFKAEAINPANIPTNLLLLLSLAPLK